MSNDRTTVSVKRDHIALMNKLFRWDGLRWAAQPEVFFDIPNMAVDMGNFVGALNAADHEQYPPRLPPIVPPTWSPPTEVHANSWQGDHVWGDNMPVMTRDGIYMEGDRWLSFAVAVPPSAGGIMSVDAAEFDGPPTFRHMTISRYPNDFRDADPTGVNGPFVRGYGSTVNAKVRVGAQVAAGQTCYVNIRSWSPDAMKYAEGSCNMIIQFNYWNE